MLNIFSERPAFLFYYLKAYLSWLVKGIRNSGPSRGVSAGIAYMVTGLGFLLTIIGIK